MRGSPAVHSDARPTARALKRCTRYAAMRRKEGPTCDARYVSADAEQAQAHAQAELDDLKALGVSVLVLGGVTLAIASLPSEWWVRTLDQLAAAELYG